FTTAQGNIVGRIARLNTDGTFDTTFNTGGAGFNDEVNKLFVQSDDKIVVGGFFTTYNGATQNRLIRLDPDGSVDTTFVTGTGIPGGWVQSFAFYDTYNSQESNEQIFVGGSVASYNGTA